MDFTVYQGRKGRVTNSSTVTHLWSLLSHPELRQSPLPGLAPGHLPPGSASVREMSPSILCAVRYLPDLLPPPGPEILPLIWGSLHSADKTKPQDPGNETMRARSLDFSLCYYFSAALPSPASSETIINTSHSHRH